MQSLYSAVHQLGDLQRELKALSLNNNLSSSQLATLTDTLTTVANNQSLLNGSQSYAINQIVSVLNQMIPVVNQLVNIILMLVPAFNTLIAEVNYLADIESLIAQKLVKLWTDTYFDVYPTLIAILQALNVVFGSTPALPAADSTLVNFAASNSTKDFVAGDVPSVVFGGPADLGFADFGPAAALAFPALGTATLDQTALLEAIGKMQAFSTRLTATAQNMAPDAQLLSSASRLESKGSMESAMTIPLAGSLARLGKLTGDMTSITQGLKLIDLIQPLSGL